MQGSDRDRGRRDKRDRNIRTRNLIVWWVVILVSISLSACGKRKIGIKPLKPLKVSYNKTRGYKLIKIPERRIKIPEDLLEPVFLLPSKEVSEALILRNRVTLTVDNIELGEVLKLISKATGVDIICSKDIDLRRKISLQVTRKSLKKVLDILCEMLGYYYEVKEGTVYLKQYQTRYYDIGIPRIVVKPNITVGNLQIQGGGTETGGVSVGGGGGFGGVTYSFLDLENENPYKYLESMVRGLLSPGGKLIKINEDIGLMIVRDKKEVLDQIDKLVERFKYFYSKQVQVEMSIIQVTFSKEKKREINWDLLISKLRNVGFSFSSSANAQVLIGEAANSLELGSSHPTPVGNILKIQKSVLSFLKQYGETEVITSPVLRLTNGYSALVVAGVWKPYFKKTESAGSNGTVAVNWEETTYLQGALLNVTVKINNENDIYLQVVPMITDIIGEVTTQDASITSPVTMMRQATTILKLHNNDIAILAGLKGKKLIKNRSGIPYLMNIKGLNFLTGGKDYTLTTTEIVMVIHVKLLY